MEVVSVDQMDHINTRTQKRKYPDISTDKSFMESGACPPFIKPVKQDEDKDCELTPILSSKQFPLQSHITSLYMIPTKYKLIIREFKNDYHTSIASKLITPYDWWLNNKIKLFSLRYNFLRSSPTFNYATPIGCGNNPQNIIELDPDSDDEDFYVLTPEPLKREAPQMFKPTQIKTITPNTFTTQDAGIYSNAEIDQFWNRVLFAKQSDTTLQLLGKSLSYEFITVHNERHSYSGPNPCNLLRIGIHDHLLNLLPIFNPDWFSQAFINFFGYPCYVLTQCGIYFSTFLFIREVLTFLLKFYRTTSTK